MAWTTSVSSAPKATCCPSRRSLALVAVTVALLTMATAGEAQLPVGPTVINGNATIGTVGNAMTISNSPNAILNWQGFSIGATNSVYFQQHDASSQVLNRVVGNDPSRILGSLASNGRVWLVNPHGVLFGQNARIDVAGLVATSLDISNADFLSGRYAFARPDSLPAAEVGNRGEIRTSFGGRVWLIGDSVRNEGVVETPGGRIVLAAGRSLELVDSGLPNLVVRVSAAESAAINLGSLLASDGGKVDVYGSIVNQQGIIRADSLGVDAAGMITLRAQDELTLGDTSQTSASALGSGSGGTILAQSDSGTTLLSGEISATSAEGKGGKIHLLGENVGVFRQASVDASGATGGGEVLVGGDYQGGNPAIANATATYLGSTALLKANATASGDGGRVIVWGNEATRAFGSIEARGAPLGGNGGLIETSGKFLDVAGIRVSAGATKGSAGLWLLDPIDLRIFHKTGEGSTGNVAVSGSPPNFSFAATATPANLADDDISKALNEGNNVTVRTSASPEFNGSGDLSMAGDARIVYTRADAHGLTLEAHRNISIEKGAQITVTGAGALEVDLNANTGGTESAQITIDGATIQTQGGALSIHGTSSPAVSISGSNISTSDGDISIVGNSASSDGVSISSSSVVSNGQVSIVGSSTGPNTVLSHGVEIDNSTISGGSGVNILGTSTSNDGIRIHPASHIISNNGKVDIKGLSKGSGTYGILANGNAVGDTAISAGGAIALTGETSDGTGLSLGQMTLGGANQRGDIILRARNHQDPHSSIGLSTTSIRTSGSLVLLPGGLEERGEIVAPATRYDVVDAPDIPINVGTTYGGDTPRYFQLNPDDLSAIDSHTGSVIIGSSSHVGKITVASGLTLANNLTLQNQGKSSEGIQFANINVGDRTLALASSGPLLQAPESSIQAGELLLLAQNSSLAMTTPNKVKQLAVDPPSSFSFVNTGTLTIGPMSANTFNSTTGSVTELAANASSSSGNFFVQTLSGPLTLAQAITTTDEQSNITLVSGSFFKNVGGSLTPGTSGRWLIYAAATPSESSLNGLHYDFVQYDAPYPTAPEKSGNGILYATPGDEVKPPDTSQFINSVNVAVNLATNYASALGTGSVIDTIGSATPMGFGKVDLGSMSMDQLSSLLDARREFKRKLFADAIFRLKLDPSLADVRPCLTQADVATGLCRVTEAQIGAMAKTSKLGLWKQRKVRIAELPRIERKMAIFFGVDDYSDKEIPPLENALADANAMAALFAERLGYEVRVLRNPTKAAIIQTLNQLAIETSDKDSVLIYYAGHGLSLAKDGEGYWIPADGPVDDPSGWVSNRDITKYLAAIRANQITMISDSCYSGAFAREGRVLVAADLKPDEVLQKRSVVVLSSGGDEPVADAGREGHSIFAWYLLDTLARMQNWQPGNTVFSTVQSEVVHAFPQTPRYGAMTSAGHQQGGDYLFEFRQLEAGEAASPALK